MFEFVAIFKKLKKLLENFISSPLPREKFCYFSPTKICRGEFTDSSPAKDID